MGDRWAVYWILDGHTPKRATQKEWVAWMSKDFAVTKRVALEGGIHTPYGDAEVSTVFLSLDHNWSGKGPPILFETMIFGGLHTQRQWRYATWDQAVTGHNAVVRALREGKDPEEAWVAAFEGRRVQGAGDGVG